MSLFKEKLELKVEETELAAQQVLSGFPKVLKWLLILALLGSIPVYFAAKKLANIYWSSKLKNFSIQAKPSFSIFQDLVKTQAKVITYQDGSFGAIIELTNPNTDLSSSQVNYSWQFFNTSGQQVIPTSLDGIKGSFYILPSSKKTLVVPKIISQEAIGRAELILEPIKWQKKLKVPTVKLSVSPATTNQQQVPLNFSAEASVLNNSPYQIKQVRLIFTVSDSSGQIIAVSQRTENDLKPYERRAFKQVWPNFIAVNPLVQITAETNALDPQNLVLSEQQNGSSDLSRPKTDNSWGF